jgi:hypothetical protein
MAVECGSRRSIVKARMPVVPGHFEPQAGSFGGIDKSLVFLRESAATGLTGELLLQKFHTRQHTGIAPLSH